VTAAQGGLNGANLTSSATVDLCQTVASPMYPALDRPDLLATPVEAALRAWTGPVDIQRQVTVAEIDPELADTAAFCSRYCVVRRNSKLRDRRRATRR
jgi:hypothetical protein